MPLMMYYSAANPRLRYWTIVPNDPNIPAGYVYSQGSDGAIPEAVQQYQAGINNQGAGSGQVTNGDPDQLAAQPNWPNGILNGYAGGGTQAPGGWPK